MSWDRLLREFREPASLLLDEKHQFSERKRQQLFKQLIEKHNELCVAYKILFQENGHRCIELEYEPISSETEKRIDFHAITNIKESIWVEVKTIHPDDSKDEEKDWQQYQKSQQHFPSRTELTIPREPDGANIWHDSFASRIRMLEYALEFEKRIDNSLISMNEICVLAFVGNGYDWRLDQLEDFVTFYRTGKHLHGDIFQKMENYKIQEDSIKLSRRIDRFAYFKRGETSVEPDLVIWNVMPPTWPIGNE